MHLWMMRKGGTAHEESLQGAPRARAAAHEKQSAVGAGGPRELLPMWTHVEQCLKGEPCDLEPC